MGLWSGILKAGVAKKIYDEARRPENQERLRALVEQARSRRGGGFGGGRRGGFGGGRWG